jgi:hypothetical protein
MNIGASILIGQSIEDLRREGIQTPPTHNANPVLLDALGSGRERRYAKNDESNARLKKAAQELDAARAAVRQAQREYEAARSATVGTELPQEARKP